MGNDFVFCLLVKGNFINWSKNRPIYRKLYWL